MLHHAWYLTTDHDWWATVSESPRPSPEADRLAGELAEQFGDEGGLGPDHTVFAVEVMLHAVHYLSDAIPHARVTLADAVHTARLLLGLNLAIAHLAQLTPRLADQIDTGTGPMLTGMSDPARGELVKALTTTGCRLEEAASLFKEAHVLFPRPAEPRS